MNFRVIVIPRKAYNILLVNCDRDSPEFDILVNTFVMRDRGNEFVQIPCDDAEFDLILNLAVSKCPEIVSVIRLAADRQLRA